MNGSLCFIQERNNSTSFAKLRIEIMINMYEKKRFVLSRNYFEIQIIFVIRIMTLDI